MRSALADRKMRTRLAFQLLVLVGQLAVSMVLFGRILRHLEKFEHVTRESIFIDRVSFIGLLVVATISVLWRGESKSILEVWLDSVISVIGFLFVCLWLTGILAGLPGPFRWL